MTTIELLTAATNWYRSALEGHLRGSRVSLGQIPLLLAVALGPVPLVEVSTRFGITRQAGHQMARAMQAIGLVKIEPGGSGKAKRVMVTPRGGVAAAHVHRAIEACDRELAGRIGADRLAILQELLTRWPPTV